MWEGLRAWLPLQEVDCRSEYSASFSTAGIDGLHLLELSSMEMSGMYTCVYMCVHVYTCEYMVRMCYK